MGNAGAARTRASRDILDDNPFAARAAQDAGVELGELELMIRPYAERADWAGLGVEAERLLDDSDIGDSPFPWVTGSDWFANTTRLARLENRRLRSVRGWENTVRATASSSAIASPSTHSTPMPSSSIRLRGRSTKPSVA